MKKTLLALFVIFLSGYFLRVLFLKDLSLTFGYDQARDAYHALEIGSGHLKILGPPASTPGLYHGVFYYYLLAPAYLIGHGNPIVAAYWVALLSTATIFIIFALTYLMTKKKGAALTASFLFAISFEATQYATWLSNPTMGVFTVALLYLGLWMWITNPSKFHKIGPILCGVGLGLSIQSEIFLAYHFIPILIWVWWVRRQVSKKQITIFVLTLIITLSSMIISEFKFGFRSLGGIVSLASSKDSIIASKGLGDILLLYLNQLGKVFSYNSYPANIGYGGILVLVLIIYSLISWDKKSISWKPFLATWLLGHITVVSLGGTSTPFLLVGVGSAVSILLGIYLFKWWSENSRVLAIILTLVLTVGNLSMIFRENPKGSTIFAIQKDMLLSRQIRAIDDTYTKANGKPFSINSLTSPLWINIVWTYLYKWYGGEKYLYVPKWTGRDQVGQIDLLEQTKAKINPHFLIIEPLAGIPYEYLGLTVGEEDVNSKTVEEKYFGEIRIQEREYKKI
ncbi:hypothetical protein HY045_00865 [Candidatus Woesebacteria bacterium]|nr:hypothetical protein [Candidatus Woesebacteria bacterium]